MSGETKFSVMCSLFNWIQKSKSSTKKRSKFRKFLDTYCKPTDYFAAVRLILPNLDRERGSYGLKESVLATCIIDALGMSRESPDALRLINWRKGGAKTGVNAGNFSLVASEVLQRRQGMISGGLTIKELNDLLDCLASSENRTEKISVLSDLIKKTNAQEMKWIIMIILKDLKLGISEKSIFHEFHPDAEDLFNVTCDLKLVCERLRDRHQRHKRQDIEVGKAVRPQLALRVANAASAWKKLHGKEVVIECKFDGDRIQIHKNGEDIHFFSRNFLDHPEYIHGMSNIIIQNVLVDRCILDGEMLVWDTSNERFAEFGSNQEIAKAAKEGLASERQLCYVAFDILYDGDTSVIHQSLKERHELLKKVVKPVKGRLEILVPDGGLNVHRTVGEPCWSQVAHNVDDVETFFKRTIENRDEGIVLKDLGSKWEPSDRSGKWLKLKPEYVRAGADLDVLIIGGYYGSGRRGGQVAQFLVGLAERPASNTYPRRFISFCRVGTGLSDEELDAVVNKLKPYFRKYEYPKKGPPSYFKVTNNSKERPDVWIDSPEKSIILSITSDIRTIRSEVFAAPYSLRFPRIDKVRDDKPWHECLDVESFVELVHSSNHTTQWGGNYEKQQENKPKRSKSSRTADKKSSSVVPSHLLQTDVSQIKGETLIFSNMMFYFVNVPPTHSLDSFHKMVAENGGTFSMNLNNSVTHCIAAESRGIKFQGAKNHGDVIHYSWLLDCCSQKKLVPLQPKYFLVLSESSKKKLQEEIDEFSDAYYLDIDIKDMEQLLNNINRSEDSKTIDYYTKKYCPLEKWSRFNGCCMYFYKPANCLGLDWEALLELTTRRIKLEVCFGGGKVSSSISNATHLVVMSLPGFNVDFDTIVKSFSASERRLLRNKNLHIVDCQWLEDCSEKDLMLQEEEYSMRPSGFIFTESTSSENRGGKMRGRPINTKTSTRGRIGLNQRQRTRARSGNKAVKIHEHVSADDDDDDEVPVDESHVKDDEKSWHEMQDVIAEDTEVVEKAINVSPNAKVTTEYSGKMADAAANKESDKLEVMVDPVQAMLLDMIPSLEPKTENKTVVDPPVAKRGNPTLDSNPGPSKKKKVSYKDLAMELLKD
ncbi:DNA ligase 4 isoform X2 [Cynara cardunculus var. scolymus]|uniref:DNA ligase 4 isoform X2 n=2 Tax=Cynara cardunculus var. scolymus TaxID=59895 RepID=UPI000D628C85|nr:DNA ligase 4 isoform X2 [Cynara cardunculus var. scolymus]